MNQTEIMFKTMERKTKLTDGKVCYQGQLVHNRVLDAQSTEAAGNEIAARTSCGQSASALLRKPEPSCSRSVPCGLRATDEGRSRRREDGKWGKLPDFGLT